MPDDSTPDRSAMSVVQVAIVVRDLEATIRAYRRALGWGPWRVYDFRELAHHSTAVRGTPATYAMRTALTRVGQVDFEIIEPLGPSPYQEFLDSNGQGLHHIQCRSDDPAGMRVRLEESGLPALMGGHIRVSADVDLEYAYHDGGDALHLILETTYGDREQLLSLPTTIMSGD
ncbi:VOC family protein [Saccharomonospora sp. NPDC046836]|uniref:VOC family protein n=1 Tax=Saccharomonospora sp. NPDC046836 TaxID=3156921 RepID=UPI0033EA5A5B